MTFAWLAAGHIQSFFCWAKSIAILLVVNAPPVSEISGIHLLLEDENFLNFVRSSRIQTEVPIVIHPVML